MTIGEQSVSAMIPKLTFLVSGASDADSAPTQPVGRPEASNPRADVFVETERNFRRDNGEFFGMVVC